MNLLRIVVAALAIGALGMSGAAVGSLPAAAQGAGTQEALAAARELSAIVNKDVIKQMTTQVTSQVWPSLEQSLRGKKHDITAAQLAELRSEFERIQFENLKGVMDDAPVVFARHFTAAELREMLAFHRSPVGQKSLRLMPQIMVESMALVMPKMPQLQSQIMESFTKILRQKGFSI